MFLAFANILLAPTVYKTLRTLVIALVAATLGLLLVALLYNHSNGGTAIECQAFNYLLLSITTLMANILIAFYWIYQFSQRLLQTPETQSEKFDYALRKSELKALSACGVLSACM